RRQTGPQPARNAREVGGEAGGHRQHASEHGALVRQRLREDERPALVADDERREESRRHCSAFPPKNATRAGAMYLRKNAPVRSHASATRLWSAASSRA